MTAVCCKLGEYIIAQSIMNYLEDNSLLTDNQHGFRKKQSRETQLILFVDELAKNLCDGKKIDVAVMDFSKAFDVIPRKHLLSKLQHYGNQGHTLTWMEDSSPTAPSR